MSNTANNVTTIDSKKPLNKQELIAANIKQNGEASAFDLKIEPFGIVPLQSSAPTQWRLLMCDLFSPYRCCERILTMNTKAIADEIDQEIARLKHIRALLLSNAPNTKTNDTVASATLNTGVRRKKRTVSAAAREKIASAQRARWAASRSAAVPAKAARAKKTAKTQAASTKKKG